MVNFAIYIFLPALIAGLIQGVTGFGAGIIMMMFLPLQFSVVQSAGISGAVSLVLCSMMVFRYRKFINFKKVIGPVILFNIVNSIFIIYSKSIDQKNLMKLILGIFLMILSIYFLFFSDKNFKPNKIVSILCIIISGICGGLFGTGGPLMVIYYLAKTDSKEEYLGTIQCLFLINTCYSTLFRIINGIITTQLISNIFIGMIGIIIGVTIANKIVNKLNTTFVRKLTYCVIGVSGLYNVVMALL